jgi:hypothetical protein
MLGTTQTPGNRHKVQRGGSTEGRYRSQPGVGRLVAEPGFLTDLRPGLQVRDRHTALSKLPHVLCLFSFAQCVMESCTLWPTSRAQSRATRSDVEVDRPAFRE